MIQVYVGNLRAYLLKNIRLLAYKTGVINN